MQRREFLMLGGSLVVVVPVAAALSACGDGGGDDGGNPSGMPSSDESGNLVFTSSLEDGHTHDFQLTVAEIDDAPANGIERETTRSEGHTHRVELTVEDLQALAAGGSVGKTTSLDLGHTHQFTFRRA